MDFKKVLILGIGQSNFLNQLYSGVNKESSDFEFSINNYHHFGDRTQEVQELPYNDFHHFNEQPVSTFQLLFSLLHFSRKKIFWEMLFFELSQKKSMKQLFNHFHKLSEARYRVLHFVLPLKYDVYHFHFCVPDNLLFLYFIPKKSKVICSFWGSDLMRYTGVSNVFYVEMALKNSTRITVQTNELAEYLFCKYGRKFKKKTREVRFTLDPQTLNEITDKKNNEKEIIDFKKANGIPLNKIIILLGHNAFSENNHIKIFNAVKKLEKELLGKACFIFHLSYGGNNEYLDELKNLIQINEHVGTRILTEFYGPREMALFRLSTDIMVHMPITDALSASMTEVLFTGNIVVAGSWLPYNILRRNGIKFIECENFGNLTNVLEYALLNMDVLKNNNFENSHAIRELLFPECTTPEWIKIFKEVSS